MISKATLANNISYFGIHMDTSVAKWDSKEQCFWYVALYSRPVAVRLMHPEDGGSFIPIGRLFGYGDHNTTTNGIE